jgi:glycosyltransferase involved in cell wall biosynthesis
MHVLYFHQHFTTPKGASGIRSYKMARALVAQGHSVTMVCGSLNNGATGLTQSFSNGKRRGLVDGIDVVEFDLSYSNKDGFLRRIFIFMKYAMGSVGLVFSERYDLVFATSTPLTAGIPGIVAKWFKRKPFVFEVRDLWPELPRQMGVITNPLLLAGMSVLEKLSYVSANRCIALSPGIAEGIARRGIAAKQISMIPNGCDLDLFAGKNAKPWRPANIRDSNLLAVFAGTHGQANGLDAVLDAAKVLLERGRDSISILLIGDGKLKPALVERTRNEDISNVVFHDPVDKSRLAGLMVATDVGLQCLANVPAFYYGTSPNKFFDYAAAGIPVLCNYPGWIADLIMQNNCGYAVGPEDASAFANALERAAESKSELVSMSTNIQALARRDFDRDTLAAKWIQWVIDGPGA